MNKEQLKAKYKDEKIFAVPFDKVADIPDGFTPVAHYLSMWKRFDNMGDYYYRYDIEGDANFQQIIPYIVIFNEAEDKVFTTTRLAGDARLTNKLSIACGGHIDVEDGDYEVLFKAAVRELMEEVSCEPISRFEIKGYVRDLNSNTNDHLGVVIFLSVKDDATIKEKNNLKEEWMSLKELINNYNKLESWSKYIVDHLVVINQEKTSNIKKD